MKKSESKEMLNEGIINTIKDKLMSVGKKLLSKFSPEEQASMKAAAEKVLGPNYSKEDITLDKAKKIGKIISGGLDESQQLDENLIKKIGNVLVGLGLPTAFVAGHGFGGTNVGAITAGIGIAAAMLGYAMTAIDEAQEAPKSNKIKKSELKEMIKMALSEDARTDAEQEGYKDGFEDAKDDIEAKLKDMKVSEGDYYYEDSMEDMSLDDQAKAYFLEKVKRGEIDTLPEDPKAAFLDQMTKDQMDHDKETLRRERGLEEQEEEEVEITDTEEEEVETPDTEKEAPSLTSSNDEKILNSLEAALSSAQELGDEKLINQIGNTITFFTRQHIVKEEDLFEMKRMKRLAGILK